MSSEEVKELKKRLDEMQASFQQCLLQQPRVNLPTIPLPKPVDIKNPDIPHFKESWENYKVASRINSLEKKEQAAILRTAMGEDCFKVISNLKLEDAKMNDPDQLLIAMEGNVAKEKNVIYNRAIFNETTQDNSEGAEIYIDKLRGLIKVCDYGEMESELLRDRLVVSTIYSELKIKFMSDKDLTLEKVINTIKAYESAQDQIKSLKDKGENETEKEVYQVQRQTTNYRQNRGSINCNRCGSKHEKNLCSARDKTCGFCGIKGHFKKACFKFKKTQANVNFFDENNDNFDEELLYSIELVNEHSDSNDSKKSFAGIKFKVGDEEINVKCQLDIGATVNVIGFMNLKKIFKNNCEIRASKVVIRSFGNFKLKPLGETIIRARVDGKMYSLVFQVMDFDHLPMLSNNTCKALGLVKIMNECLDANEVVFKINSSGTAEQILEANKELFNGLGKLNRTIKLQVKEDIIPSIQTPRRIPIHYRQQLKTTLEELEGQGIIKKVEQHTPWVSNLLLVKRNDKMRLCLDPVRLNQALLREEYQMPTIDEIFPELCKAKVFSTFDAKKGFWQLPLDEESSLLTTFWTPFGRFRWTRVPFGISPAPEIFTKHLREILHDIPNVVSVADDILVYGKGDTMEEALMNHNDCLKKLFARLKEVGLKLNPEKIKLCRSEIKYYGHILSCEGVRPDNDKIQALESIKCPDNKKDLLTFLGMVTYLSRFLPNLSTISEPLRNLCKENVKWHWSKQQDSAFMKLKEMIKESPCLAYFDLDKKITIECDASEKGLGAVLLQEGKPVIYASKTLSSAEKKYAQIEKEALAILFACKRFEQFIFGKEVEVFSDHKPLEVIWKKPIVDSPKRLQRILFNLQPYNLNILHRPGKLMFLSDALSRISSEDNSIHVDKIVYAILDEIEQVHEIDGLDLSDSLLSEIKNATANDPVLQEIKNYVMTEWPKNVRKMKHFNSRKFFAIKNEIVCSDGLLVKGREQIIIPESLQQDVSNRLHRSHLGISYTLQFARRTVFWPGFSEDIRRVCSECNTCKKFSAEMMKMPMQSTEVASYPGEILSMDIFDLVLDGQRKQYLVIVDHYSDYFEIKRLINMQSDTIITILKEFFSRLGVPKLLICDNAKQFLSNILKIFSSKWAFKIATSDPYHSQGNGKAEATVKSAKQLLKKAEDSNEDYRLLLLQHRNTPNSTGFSPNDRMLGRSTNIPNIPQLKSSLTTRNSVNVKSKLIINRRKAKNWYDKKTRVLPNLNIGQPVFVRIKPGETRVPGSIVEKAKDRSYLIKTNSGTFRRNRNDIVDRTPEQNHEHPSGRDDLNSSTASTPLEFFSPPDISSETSNLDAPSLPGLIQNNETSFADHNTPRTSRYGRAYRRPIRLNL